MNKEIAKELKAKAVDVAMRFSNSNRAQNFDNETFEIYKILPCSDHVATVIFKKSSGKSAAAFFYYIPNGASKGWRYFFPTDSHITGMRAFELHKMKIELDNYKFNFNEL